VVAVGLAVVFASRGGQRELGPTVIGSLAGAMAIFLTLIGPNLMRDDLRCDLLQIDLLKTYPLPGWSVVLGEILAPVAALAVWQWALLVIAMSVLPSVGRIHPSISQRILVGLSASFLLPCFSLIGVLIQNAAALIMPGWVQLGKERARGVEAMGQNLITMVATVLVLVLALIPAGLIFALVFIPAYLAGYGLPALPVASLFAALGLLAETGLAIIWLGRMYDRFDVSLEGSGR
jgi:ABC-2 type transport system permease protein